MDISPFNALVVLVLEQKHSLKIEKHFDHFSTPLLAELEWDSTTGSPEIMNFRAKTW